jgi:hypothetical protein
LSNPSKRKGDRAELEVQGLWRDHVGVPARRALGAGRKDDVGDIHGIPDTVVSVANYADIARAIREKLPDVEVQRRNAGALFAAMFVRKRGGGYVVCMTPDQFFVLWREAQPIGDLTVRGIAEAFGDVA